MKKNGLPRALPPGFVLSEDGRTARKIGSRPFEGGKAALPSTGTPAASPIKIGEVPLLRSGKRRGEMNKTEREASLILRAENPGALILYEAVTFRVGGLRYTADFMILPEGGGLPVFVETKGPYKYEKDIVRMKAAAALLPFRFHLWQRQRGGEWTRTIVKGAADGQI